MAIIHANDDNFSSLTSNGTVLVDFYADWCGPCRMLSPIIEDLASDRNEVKFVKVNVDEAHDTAKTFGVMSIPTIILLKNVPNLTTFPSAKLSYFKSLCLFFCYRT